MFMNGIFYVLNLIGIPNIGLAIIIMTILIKHDINDPDVPQQRDDPLHRPAVDRDAPDK